MLSSEAANGDTRRNADVFPGFEPLTGNFLYCPNQFFDVCLPNYSRGVLRLVAFMLRRTLGWLDKDGNPIEQDVKVSYSDLISKAGVSRGAARKAIEEAIEGGFIRRTRHGRVGSREFRPRLRASSSAGTTGPLTSKSLRHSEASSQVAATARRSRTRFLIEWFPTKRTPS